MSKIGIIGGVGPYAGKALFEHILDIASIRARSDQDYPELLLYNASSIPDRTEYLLDPRDEKSPEKALKTAVDILANARCRIVGIPCNTAHSPDILSMISSDMDARGLDFVHMVDETLAEIYATDATITTIGLLATKGTYTSNVYGLHGKKRAQHILSPETEEERNLVHSSIYNPEYGIKTFSQSIRSRAIDILQGTAETLIANGAQAIILGCTEISLVQSSLNISVPCFDPLVILATKLVFKAYETVD